MIKTCAVCRKDFRTLEGRRKLCSMTCRNVFNGIRSRGRVPVQAIAAAKRRMDVIQRERLRELFGELSVREIAVFKWAWRRAYNRGYVAGRSESRKLYRRRQTQEIAA